MRHHHSLVLFFYRGIVTTTEIKLEPLHTKQDSYGRLLTFIRDRTPLREPATELQHAHLGSCFAHIKGLGALVVVTGITGAYRQGWPLKTQPRLRDEVFWGSRVVCLLTTLLLSFL